MTAAQNTIQWSGSNWLAGLAAAAVAGLVVAVIAVAVSARPVVAPAPAQAITPSQQSSLYFEEMLEKGNQAVTLPPSQSSSLYLEELLEKGNQASADAKAADAAVSWSIVPTITPSEQANAYLQSELRKHELYVQAQKLRAAGLPPHRLGGPHRG